MSSWTSFFAFFFFSLIISFTLSCNEMEESILDHSSVSPQKSWNYTHLFVLCLYTFFPPKLLGRRTSALLFMLWCKRFIILQDSLTFSLSQ
jgi:hypothetical protein